MKSQPRRFSSGATLRMQRFSVDEPQRAAPARLAADEDVGGGVEIVEEVQFLMNKGDAGGQRLRDRQRRVDHAVDHDGSRGRRDHAAQHLHQRRFAGAVFADQADDFAGPDLKADVFQGLHARIGFGDGVQPEKGLAHGGVISNEAKPDEQAKGTR